MAMMHATRWRRIGRVPMGAVNWWRKNALALPGRDVPSLFPTGGVGGSERYLPGAFDLGKGKRKPVQLGLYNRVL